VAGGRFQPGQSGNPGGRPKDIGRLKELARKHTEEAIATLAAIMRDNKEPAAARVRAAEAMLDRAWGRPETTASVAGPDGGPPIIVTGVPRADASAAIR
jgi:hypothetical protein